MTSLAISCADADAAKVALFGTALRESDRVKPTVKEKTDGELLVHYGLCREEQLRRSLFASFS